MEALARKAGLSLNAVSRIERGERRNPHVLTLAAIAAALGVKVDDLTKEMALPKGEALGTGPKTLEDILADDELPRRIQDMDVSEVIAVVRGVVDDLQTLAPEVRRRYEDAPYGTAQKATASRDLSALRSWTMALHMALRVRFEVDPEPLPPAQAAAQRELSEELQYVLAMAG